MRRIWPIGKTVLAGLALLATRAGASSAPGGLEIPSTGAYTGAFVNFGDGEDQVTLPAIEKFEALTGKHQAIIASSSFWGRGKFPAENVRLISDHGAVPLLYWSPWGPPYDQGEDVRPDAFSLAHIVAGDCNAYIDRWAAGARDYGKPLLVSFACEMNSNWFPWGGKLNGADRHPPDGVGRYAGPELFKRTYRYVVDRVRAAGVRNIAWVFHANSTSHPNKPWNDMAEYYPGTDYVDWLGMSAYGQITPGDGDDDWIKWSTVMDEHYARLCALDPAKPVMLAEFGVGEFPGSGSKAEWIEAAFKAMNGARYPRLKAAVFWHERWQNKDESYSDLRVSSSHGALKAYEQGVADPFWLDHPLEPPAAVP